MAILRNKTQKGYTVVNNYAINDKRLSLKAMGLLVKMLSLPDYWDFSEAGLVAIVKDGQSAVRSGLKELESLGYLLRRRVKDENGRFTDCEWEIYETPQVENPNMESARLEIVNNKVLKETSTKEENTEYISPHAKKLVKHKHGEYQNVLLTDEDLSKLKAEFPNDWQSRIERLSEYMASTGKSYKNHLATIRNWAKRDYQKQSQKQAKYNNADEEYFKTLEELGF